MFLIRECGGKIYHLLNKKQNNSLCRLERRLKGFKQSEQPPINQQLCKSCLKEVNKQRDKKNIERVNTKSYGVIVGKYFIESKNNTSLPWVD